MNKRTIAIVELHYHAEVLQQLFELLDFERFHFRLFVAAPVAKQLTIPKNLETFIVQSSITEHRKAIEQCDILFFSTLADYFHDLQPFIENKPSIVRIHNVNTWFGEQGMAKPHSAYERWKFASHFLRKEFFGKLSAKRQESIQQIDQFVFPAQFMLNTARQLQPTLFSKFYQTPIGLTYQSGKEKKPSSGKHIVIPGRIDQRKKDYGFAFRVLEQLAEREEQEQIKVTLLGMATDDYGKKVIRQFQSLVSETMSVEIFDAYIPQDKFANTMRQADVLFLPIVQETSFTMFREVYGQTKISGAINDALAYRKPVLVPNFYPLEEPLLSVSTFYSSEKEAIEKLSAMLKEECPVEMQNLITKSFIKEQYTKLFESI